MMRPPQPPAGAPLRVALASTDIAWESKETNLQRCDEEACRAADHGAALVAFPEMTATGFTMNAAQVSESAGDSETIRRMSAIAARNAIAVCFGVVLTGRVRPTNSCVVVDAGGRELARYAKIHPFSAAQEHTAYEGGSALVTTTVKGVRFGLTICYDLRFPELYSALAPACDAILVIANWPAQRIEHWRTLLTARAIEGQCYVLGVNRRGRDPNGHEYPRSSYVFGPRGEQLAPVVSDGGLDVFELDASTVDAWRRAFPIAADRRVDVYARLLRP